MGMPKKSGEAPKKKDRDAEKRGGTTKKKGGRLECRVRKREGKGYLEIRVPCKWITGLWQPSVHSDVAF